MIKFKGLAVALVLGLGLSGCAAIAVVDTAVSVTSTVVGAAVDVGGAVVSRAADTIAPSKDGKPDCSKEANKDKDACKAANKD